MPSSKRARSSARDAVKRAPQAYNGHVREQLADLQRARLISAMVEVCCERGTGNVSVAHVVERSGVSRRTFYEHFDDREDCFLGAFEQALAVASERVIPAYQSGKGWRERIRASLIALLSLFDEQPTIGWLLTNESLAGGPRALERRGEMTATLTSVVDDGRREVKAGSPPPLTAEGVVGGVTSVIHSRLAERDCGALLELTNPLMSMIVLPYLGTAAARRELERPVTTSTPKRSERIILADPFKDAGMRLTYRTVRVLMAIAQCPGASNREIGEVAEVKDQGQISKLLARLQRIGLVANTGLGPGQGAPNAWTVTDKGRQVTDAIRAHASYGEMGS